MKTFRALIRPRSAALSPWQADMVFGQLCWVVRYERGAAALEALLAHYRAGEPPLLFSNGYPGDWLPRPLLPHQPPEARRSEWVRTTTFEALRCGLPATNDEVPNFIPGRAEPKNRVSRTTGRALPNERGTTGYQADALMHAAPQIDGSTVLDMSVFVRAADDTWAAQARDWIELLARGGYGARKSAGYGQFSLEAWEPWSQFDAPVPAANGFISLSHWVPAQPDPTQGQYTTLVKRGKLGEELAGSANPFKYPLLMLAAGSCFYTNGPPRPWYGRLVEHIAELPTTSVVHYGYAFAVPARLESEP